MEPASSARLLLFLSTAASLLQPTTAPELPLRYRILEEQPVGTVVADIPTDSGLTTRYNQRELSGFTYKFLKAHANLAISLKTGVITVATVLDRDAMCPGKVDCVTEVIG